MFITEEGEEGDEVECTEVLVVDCDGAADIYESLIKSIADLKCGKRSCLFSI